MGDLGVDTAQECPTIDPPMTDAVPTMGYTCEGGGQSLEPYGNQMGPKGQGTLKRGL